MSRERFEGMTNIELAEFMVENAEEFEGRDAVEIAENWDRCDMIKECLWADGDGDDEE